MTDTGTERLSEIHWATLLWAAWEWKSQIVKEEKLIKQGGK
uniref:Uncharacterized protein n=1 Tax=viral metagenome TaxID=1070528 RepID=A0A6M3XXF9_9ZZZZ